jgi:pimeloyl-ACP methyl ester carboxylesterase
MAWAEIARILRPRWYFARQGRVLTAELRGRGESDKPQQAYSIEGFAEDLVWLCTRQQIIKPVIVGLSMGGNMALEIAASHPEFPAGLVLLDSGVLFLPQQRRCSPGIWRA